MPGEISIKIKGDATQYDATLSRVKKESKETKEYTDNLLKETITKDNFIGDKIESTLHRVKTDIAKTDQQLVELSLGIEIEIRKHQTTMFETMQKMGAALLELKMDGADVDAQIRDLYKDQQNLKVEMKATNVEIDATQKKFDAFKTESRDYISGTLTTIRAISDMAALYSAATGEQIDVTAFAMISMAMTSMLQVKAQAAVFAVTPGLQPLAMMMLAMLPMFTGLIIMIKKTQTDINSQMKATSTTQMDSMLDGFPY